MNIRYVGTIVLSLVASTMLSAPVLAQEQPDPGHPRINQVDNRLAGQESNTLRAEQRGNLTAGQANRDERRDQQIQRQEERDAAKHGGHLTKHEQRKLNHEMNRERREKMRQEHRGDRMHREEHRENEGTMGNKSFIRH